MVHCLTVHLPLGALLIPCTMCGTGEAVMYGSRASAAAATALHENVRRLRMQMATLEAQVRDTQLLHRVYTYTYCGGRCMRRPHTSCPARGAGVEHAAFVPSIYRMHVQPTHMLRHDIDANLVGRRVSVQSFFQHFTHP